MSDADVVVVKSRDTSIKRCTCYNEFQDEKHGKGLRVHNRRRGGGIKGTGSAGWRCTTCGRDK